ncbi:MAG: hypothetical protein AAF849_23445 [Bacteroidota bacterium]
MFRYTKSSLKKLELLLEEVGYIIRYEKGNFQSGYCIVRDKKVVIVNKFFDTDARINSLLEVVNEVEIMEAILSERSAKFYKLVKQKEEEDDEESK